MAEKEPLDILVLGQALEQADITDLLAEIFIRSIKRTKVKAGMEWLTWDDKLRFEMSMGMFGTLIDENMQTVIDGFVGKGQVKVGVETQQRNTEDEPFKFKH